MNAQQYKSWYVCAASPATAGRTFLLRDTLHFIIGNGCGIHLINLMKDPSVSKRPKSSFCAVSCSEKVLLRNKGVFKNQRLPQKKSPITLKATRGCSASPENSINVAGWQCAQQILSGCWICLLSTIS